MPPSVPISAWWVWDLQLFKEKLFILVWGHAPKSLSEPSRERALPVGQSLGQAPRLHAAPTCVVCTLAERKSGGRGSKQAEKPAQGDRCRGSPEEGSSITLGGAGMLLGEVREVSEVQSLGGERNPGRGQLPPSEAVWRAGRRGRHRPRRGGAASAGRRLVSRPRALSQQAGVGPRNTNFFNHSLGENSIFLISCFHEGPPWGQY